MPKIQPSDQIGPNNAGKMILRGCFMNVSQAWLNDHSGPIGGLLSRYLNNRLGEATGISLNYGEGVPSGREHGPHKLDIDFMATAVYRLRTLEKSGTELNNANGADIYYQVTDQILVLEQEIEKYEEKCKEKGIDPMFTGSPSVTIANVKSRDPVTQAQSLMWEDTEDIFAGMTIHGRKESTYDSPKLK